MFNAKLKIQVQTLSKRVEDLEQRQKGFEQAQTLYSGSLTRVPITSVVSMVLTHLRLKVEHHYLESSFKLKDL